jgi:hypothetical protein
MTRKKKVEEPKPEEIILEKNHADQQEINYLKLKHIFDNSIVSQLCQPFESEAPTNTVKYLEMVEKDSQIGIVALKEKFLNVGTSQVSCSYTKEQMEKLIDNGIDGHSNTESILMREMSFNLNKQYIEYLSSLASISHRKTYTLKDKIFEFVFKVLKQKYVKITKIKNAKDFIVKILYETNTIASKCRYGFGDFIICNGKIANILSINSTDVFIHNNSSYKGTIYNYGKFANVSVYVDPYMSYDDNRILIGRKREHHDEPGIFCMFYKNSFSLEDINLSSPENTSDNKNTDCRKILQIRYAMTTLGDHPENLYSMINVDLKNFK